MIRFGPRVVAPRAVRLCVLGNGVALLATASPWQEWSSMALPAFGPPLLRTPGGILLAGLATAVALVSALPRTDARGLLRRARCRAWLAVTAAVLWVVPLPFGPELPPDMRLRIDWAAGYRAGAAGALAAAIGAVWWAQALAGAVLERTLRRSLGRRARRQCAPAVHLAAGSVPPRNGSGSPTDSLPGDGVVSCSLPAAPSAR